MKYTINIELETETYEKAIALERIVRDCVIKSFFIEPKITKLEVTNGKEGK